MTSPLGPDSGIAVFADEIASGEGSRPSVGRAGGTSFISSALQWLSLGNAAKAARATARAADPAQAQRAHTAAMIASRVADSSELHEDEVSGVVCELYRQSILWSLLALGAVQPSPLESGALQGELTRPNAIDSALLRAAIANREERAQVQRALESLSFIDLGTMAVEEQSRLGEELRRLALALLDEVYFARRVRQAIWATHLIRLGALVGALLLIWAGVSWAASARARARELARDLAPGRSWQASSLDHGQPGCKSPSQECADSLGYFFHTNPQREPWVEFDLERPERVSAVRVVNRRDCCTERAVPLIIEVSTDHENWTPVARRDELFGNWLAQFQPTKARWVRLRLDARGIFHLARVRILR